jgi:mono/diheme cytochrome c family protein
VRLERMKFLVALLPLALGGCDYWYNTVPSPDQLWYHIAWFDQMIHQRSIKPYSTADVPRYTVKGTVPVGGGEASWETGDAATLAYAFDAATADKLVNPTTTGGTPATPGPALPTLPGDLNVRGDTLYNTYCAVCHGHTGAGNGPVSARLVGVPSLLTDRARAYTDGYLYSMIRYGRGLMPKYGDKVPVPANRWAIVNHLRALQAAAPAPAAPPAPATGGKH